MLNEYPAVSREPDQTAICTCIKCGASNRCYPTWQPATFWKPERLRWRCTKCEARFDTKTADAARYDTVQVNVKEASK